MADKGGRIGVLIVNLGSPEGTDYRSMRRYLGEFLSDRRVIEVPRWFWLPLLNLVILSTRPQRSGRAYEAIWNRERNEAPLVTITRAQAAKLAEAFADAPAVIVDWAMRYGRPSVAERLGRLVAAGCERVLVVPLYPQYAAATTATVNDVAFDALKAMRRQPALRTAADWHDDPVYIAALAASIESQIAALGFEPEVVLASFHGVPVEYVEKGDPYAAQCRTTVRLLRERLGWGEDRLQLTFQSRFGRAEWLQPYTDRTVEALARRGVKRLAVVMPGFVADCLETLEEIGVENATLFRENGGRDFAALACLNDSAGGMAVLEAVVRRELAGWL
ncbi:ferrochelatase [Pseudoxanthobacter sp.]|uniref:ferrochelatase n=1 Tax=Pseudoxanthobacter sp. TaxID=1925742 RepID=UPI002FDF1647